ncbi:DUF4148 domain-containing protein [Paraburkholderia sp. SARCC-3016]|uniref:DUF4148 domain-containing protein n=1 Tax=Paraburkholderia sp. SARCC-3016 TaxID=3058611 RepID=UPI002809BA6A|nr:DUF4148 domain-containing protein [Paraburkholderia sp. SARCC-3016]MDQ7976304.1 DUF4148 domain-containing protein [Paraburkholderia sp. SARCC-3016]
MKRIPRIVLCAIAGVLCSTYAFADTPTAGYDPSAPKTRAQVIADFAEWRAAGYDPDDWIDYPENAIAAGRIVAARRAAQAANPSPQ